MILPRFHTSTSAEGPLVIDRQEALAAEFEFLTTAQAVCAMLNADPSRIETFYWINYEGATSG